MQSNKPRIFLGSSGKQEKLLQALTRGLAEVERLLELTREVDFAAFIFAQDDWTTTASATATPPSGVAGVGGAGVGGAGGVGGQASPRDNVVFEAGLFGGVLGMRRRADAALSVEGIGGEKET